MAPLCRLESVLTRPSPHSASGAERKARQLRNVARYYTWLDRWVRWSRSVRPYSGFDAMTVHRLLNDPQSGENGPFVIHRLLRAGLELPAEPRVLDAGCGYGGTAFDLFPEIGGTWLGLTVSPIQYQRARNEAMRRGLGERVRFALQSYDAPLAETFDLVIAIESLVHSSDPDATVSNIADALAPGGYFVMVDDMPIENVPAALMDDVTEAKRMWRCPVMPTERGWRAAFAAAGLDVVQSQDLSPLIYHRPMQEMTRLIERDRRRAWWLGWSGLGIIAEANVGGLLLERLAVRGAIQYRLLVGRKRR